MGNISSGDRLGHFEIKNRLGSGGMGSVYKGIDTTLQREVALKVLDSRMDNPESISRFQREARTIASLRHPNLMHIYSVGEQDGTHYFAMEYIKGKPLSSLISDSGGKLDTTEAVRITIEVMAALQKVHEHGIVHRDLKPANVMIDGDDNRAILVDFGLSKDTEENDGLTTDGSILGTPDYMAPEQIEGDPITPATDIYALGVMLYEMLSGIRPFRRKSTIQTLRAHCEYTPPPLTEAMEGASKRLSFIINKMIERDPNKRYPDIETLANDLIKACRHPLLKKLASAEALAGRKSADNLHTAQTVQTRKTTATGSKTGRVTDPTLLSGVQPRKPPKTVSIKSAPKENHWRTAAIIMLMLIAFAALGKIFLWSPEKPEEITDKPKEEQPVTITEKPEPVKEVKKTPQKTESQPTVEPAKIPEPVKQPEPVSAKTPEKKMLPVRTYAPADSTPTETGITEPRISLRTKRRAMPLQGTLLEMDTDTITISLLPQGEGKFNLNDIEAINSQESPFMIELQKIIKEIQKNNTAREPLKRRDFINQDERERPLRKDRPFRRKR